MSILSERNRYYLERSTEKRCFKWRRKSLVITGAILLSSVILQFLYPAGLTLPNARVGAVSLNMLARSEAATQIDATFKNWSRTVATEKHEYPATTSSIGLAVDTEKTLAGPLDYPWWQRLMPGSFIWRLINNDAQPVLAIDSEKNHAFTEQVHNENYQPAVNATIIINEGQANITPEAAGSDYPPAITAIALGQEFFGSTDKLQLKATMLNPAVSAGDAEPTLKQVKEFLAKPPAYVLNGSTTEMAAVTLGSLLEFTPNEKENKLTMGFSSAKTQAFLATLTPYIYTVPAGTVAAVDGQDITVLPGNDQKVIDVAAAITKLRETTKHIGDSQTIDISQIQLTPALKTKRDYSKSQLGLQALVQNLVAEKGNYGIALQELGGRGWAASSGGDKKFITASTYKLFVAYAVLKNIEAGAWTWGGSIAGRTIEGCFDAMIINSDNPCAEEFGSTIGWANIQSQMRGLGLANTTLSSEFTSTANDELLFMAKLGRGEILTQASRDKLLGVMKRQVYRQGIPAGVGVPVADKVGFLYGLLHDAAIVYAPQGNYALVIMTNGSSWGNIADAAKKIQQLLQ